MKKTFKLMLAFALVVLGSTSAWAVKTLGDTFENGYYSYQVTKVNGTALEATLTAIKAAEKSKVNVAGTLAIPGSFSLVDGEDTYQVTVTRWSETAFQDLTSITGISIPASIVEIPNNAFRGCTNVTTIAFAENSQVEEIGTYAFGSTHITDFDFTNCVKLRQLKDYVFVTGSTSTNSFVKTVTVPTTYPFKHINRAFVNLTELTAINNLGDSYVEEIVDSAFANTKVTELSFPGTTKYVASKALSCLTTLTTLNINVNSIESLGGGTFTTAYDYTSWQENQNNPEEGKENLFEAAPNTSLTKLVLTGELKGKIAKYAFYNCTALAGSDGTGTLDLKTNFTLGSKATIEGNAFGKCTAISALKIGNIANNETGNYTIQTNAFNGCIALASVEIDDIAATKAIATSAFSSCVAANGSTGLTTFKVGNISGSNAIAETIALGSTKLATVTIGNITAANAIAANAFKTMQEGNNSVTTVTIGDIVNAAPAMGTSAFGNNLQKVTIGSIIANGIAIPEGVFIWGNQTESELNIAQGEGKYISQSTAMLSTPAISVTAFNMSAITGGTTGFVFPVIKIGEIRSKGGAFAAGAIKAPTTIKEKLTFTGDIAQDGLKNNTNGAFLGIGEAATYTGLTAITFKGKVGTNGIPTGIFANCSKIVSFTFEDVLSEKAVSAGAFSVETAANNGPEAATIHLTYTSADKGAFDYSVNPFANAAFYATATDADDRYIYLEVADEDLLGEFENTDYGLGTRDDVKGLYQGTVGTTADYFDVFRVRFYVAPDAGYKRTFPVYANNNALGEAWGRYADFGKWAVDGNATVYAFTSYADANATTQYATGTVTVLTKNARYATIQVLTNSVDGFVGEKYRINFTDAATAANNGVYQLYSEDGSEPQGLYVTVAADANPDWPYHTNDDVTDIANGVKVQRYQKAYAGDVKDNNQVDVKVTLYGVYTDEDPQAKISSVYMVPLKVTNGFYWIDKNNNKTVIAKVTPRSGNFTASTIYHIKWTDVAPDNYNSVWTELPAVNDFQYSMQVDTHEQLWDAQNDENWKVQADIWDGLGKNHFYEGEDTKIAPNALFVMNNPASFKGFRIDRNYLTHTEADAAEVDADVASYKTYLGQNWYYTLLRSWGKSSGSDAGTPEASFRVVWLDDDSDPTAIFNLKETRLTKTTTQNDAIYNLQGVRVTESYKGIVIKNGKKYLQK